MGRLVMLIAICLVIIGALMTFHIPMNWIGQLPGDFSFEWAGIKVYAPVTTAVIASLVLSILLFAFSGR